MPFSEDQIPVMMFLLPGMLLVLVSCLCWWWSSKQRKRCTSQTNGVVSDIKHTVSHKKGSQHHRYRPTFTYSVGGVEFTRRSNITTMSPKFSVGQAVTVFHDPFKPQRYYVLEQGKAIGRFLLPIFFGTASMLFAGILHLFL